MLLHIYLRLQWLLCVTVALNWLITLHILLIVHHPTIFCSPACILKKILAGKRYRTDREVISSVEDVFEDQDESFNLYNENPSAATPMEEVCGPQGRLCLKLIFGQIRPMHHTQLACELFSPPRVVYHYVLTHAWTHAPVGHRSPKVIVIWLNPT